MTCNHPAQHTSSTTNQKNMQDISALITKINTKQTLHHFKELTKTLHQSSEIFNQNLLNAFLIKLAHYPNTDMHTFCKSTEFITVLQLFFKHPSITLTPKIIKYIYDYDTTIFITICEIYIAANKTFNSQQTSSITENYYNVFHSDRNKINIFLNKYDVFESTPSILLFACTQHLHQFIQNQINKKAHFSKDCFKQIILTDNVKIFDSLMRAGYYESDIDPENTLNIACNNHCIKILNHFFSNKILPTSSLFKQIFPTDQEDYSHTSQQSATIDLFIAYGYQLTTDDIILTIKHKTLINNFTNTTAIPDNFIDICEQHNFLPFEEYNLKPTIKYLIYVCSQPSSLPLIKKIINTGVTPTLACLQSACSIKQNITTIKYLIKTHNLKPDISCIQTQVSLYNHPSLTFLFNEFNANITPPKK